MGPVKPSAVCVGSVSAAVLLGLMVWTHRVMGATTQERYFAHPAVEDKHGVISPWYRGQNGQCDFRVRIAAETLKRYPWTTPDRAVAVAPEYAFNSTWRIAPDGTITVPPMKDWTCGDRGQMCARTIFAWIEYYRYTGDPAALAHVELVGKTLLDHNLTDADHPWPNFLISVPVRGKPYGKADSKGWIQLDIVGEAGLALLRAYQLTGNRRFLDTVKHWADVLAAKRNRKPDAAPWPRYANPEQVRWGKTKTGNIQTGGLVYQLAMLDELIRLGYTGLGNGIVEARDAGRAYLAEALLPAWAVDDTWGRNYWDWEDPVQAQTTTDWAVRYLMDNRDEFPNWKNDVRNILTLFLNHTGVSPKSRGEVYSGAWAFPESSGCCGRSLAWGPMELALDFAQYGVAADSEWARELARRMQILATYDVHETGVVEDNIDGGAIAAGGWLKSAHPSALNWVLRTIAWLPEVLGASRENHIMRSTAVVNSVAYGGGRIAYTTFDAPDETIDVLRLAFEPSSITADGAPLARRADLKANGYTVRSLPDGDAILSIRHDGHTDVVVQGDDPQIVVDDPELAYDGKWTAHRQAGASGGAIHTTSERAATARLSFRGNQVRLIGPVGPDGGQADVYVDGVKQRVGVCFWNPRVLQQQVLYYKNGLPNGRHTLKIVARSSKNPLSKGRRVAVDAVQVSAAEGRNDRGEGGGPTGPQRILFGFAARTDHVDSQGHAWRPGAEFVVRTGHRTDAVIETWWTSRRAPAIDGTPDPTLYQYGVHARDFTVNITVGPGRYDVRLKFAETEYAKPGQRPMTIVINDEKVAEGIDVFTNAGGANKAMDLLFGEIAPKNGMIEIRFVGGVVGRIQREAMVQAIEVLPHHR